jgi:hypothetical protein
LQHKKRKESEGGKNRDIGNRQIVVVKLIIQKNKTGTAATESVVCSVNVLDLFLLHPILVLELGILDFAGKGAAPLVGHLKVEVAGGFFFFFCFPWSYGPSVVSGRPEMVLPGDWLVTSIWFFLSTGQVAVGA